jgi:hypothetical protein
MRHWSLFARTAVALAITGGAAPQPAIAQDNDMFSMTGTYEGVFACDDITAGVSSGVSSPTQ